MSSAIPSDVSVHQTDIRICADNAPELSRQKLKRTFRVTTEPPPRPSSKFTPVWTPKPQRHAWW